jgi:hypothetical protein
VFALCLGLRVPRARGILEGRFGTIDEIELTLGATDRILGVPLNNAHWPGLVNQALLVPVVLAEVAWDPDARDLRGLARHLGEIERSPWQLAYAHRLVAAVLFSLAAGLCAAALYRRAERLLPVVFFVALLQAPQLLVYSSWALGNATAMACLLAASAAVLWASTSSAALLPLSGVAFVLALFCRNVSVLYLPVLIALGWGAGRARALKLMAAGAALAACLLALPVLIEPLRWFKANLGNYLQPGLPLGLWGGVGIVNRAGSGWAWIVIAVALLGQTRGRFSVVGAGFGASMLCGIALASRAHAAETRYFDSLLLGGAIASALAIACAPPLEPRLRALRRISSPWLVAGAAWLAAISDIAHGAAVDRLTQPSQRELTTCLAGLARPGEPLRLAAQAEWLYYFSRYATSASLTELADRADQARHTPLALPPWAARLGADMATARALSLNFTEKEIAYAARLRAAAVAQPLAQPELALSLYVADAAVAERFGMDHLPHWLIDRAHSGVSIVALAPDAPPVPGATRSCQLNGMDVWTLEPGPRRELSISPTHNP